MIVQVGYSGAFQSFHSYSNADLSGKCKIKFLSMYGYRPAFSANQQMSFNSYEIQNWSGGTSRIYIHDNFQTDNKTYAVFGPLEVICYLNGSFTFSLNRGANAVGEGGTFPLQQMVFTFSIEIIDANYIKKLI